MSETYTRLANWAAALLAATVLASPASAADAGDRLQWTGAVTQVEGSAGGGLVPWALIGGLETNVEVGATGFATQVTTHDFSLVAGGASIDVDDRFELSVTRQRLGAGAVLPGLTLGQDIVGAKVRLVGDAVFAPDEYLPQIALGAQWKHTLDFDQIPRTVGAARGEDVDLYLAATKLYFAALAGRNIIVDVTLRRTRANQFGLLGFGGDGSSYSYRPESSVGVFVTESLLLGAEYRDKPDNLRAFREDSAKDAFLAWSPVKNVSLVAAFTSLGRIAGKVQQSGVYLSLWLGI